MALGDMFKALKGVLTGELVERIDTKVGGGWSTLSLRLKKHGDDYSVVLVSMSSGEREYMYLSQDEFLAFAEAAQQIKSSLEAASPWAARGHAGR